METEHGGNGGIYRRGQRVGARTSKRDVRVWVRQHGKLGVEQVHGDGYRHGRVDAACVRDRVWDVVVGEPCADGVEVRLGGSGEGVDVFEAEVRAIPRARDDVAIVCVVSCGVVWCGVVWCSVCIYDMAWDDVG